MVSSNSWTDSCFCQCSVLLDKLVSVEGKMCILFNTGHSLLSPSVGKAEQDALERKAERPIHKNRTEHVLTRFQKYCGQAARSVTVHFGSTFRRPSDLLFAERLRVLTLMNTLSIADILRPIMNFTWLLAPTLKHTKSFVISCASCLCCFLPSCACSCLLVLARACSRLLVVACV